MTSAPPAREPILNVPPITLGLALVLAAIFLATHFMPERTEPLLLKMVFIPGALSWATAYTVLSYALLHFGWPHIVMNGFGLLAFGSATERLLGKAFYLTIFIGGVIIGALGHWLLFPDSAAPLGGASAGVSALFGAMLPFLVRRPQLLSVNTVFILTNIALGMTGMPGGTPGETDSISIAWQAHIFGFLFGEALGFIMIRKKISRLKKRDIETLQTTEI